MKQSINKRSVSIITSLCYITIYFTKKNVVLLIIFPFQDNPAYNQGGCSAFPCDITADDLASNVPENSIDIVTMIFVMSAILPSKMTDALKNIAKVS